MSEMRDKRWRFNDCELDLASRELWRDGELIALEPRVFALLVYLIEQRHRAVDKDQIQDSVWKGVIVSETALTRAIMKARRAVGDNAEKQSVIRTLHSHGYQFVAAVRDRTDDGGVASTVAQQRSLLPRVFAGLVVVFIVAFIVFLWPRAGSPESVRLAIMPVQNKTADSDYDWTRLGLMGLANDLITRSAKLNILPASDVIRFAESDVPLDSADPSRSLAGLAHLRRQYGATHLLLSTLDKNANGLRLRYALYLPGDEVERGTMVAAEPIALMRGMIRVVTATLGDQNNAFDEISVVSEDPFINEAYSRGLSLSLEGRCAEAQQLYEVVMVASTTVGHAEFEWASCARILGLWQEAAAGFQEILDKLPVEPPSSLRARTLDGLGTVYIRTGRGEAARNSYELALTEAISAGDYFLQGRILNSLAIEAKNRREFSTARSLLERSVLAHTNADAGPIRGQVPAAYANIDMAEGKLDQADDRLHQALSRFRAIGDRRNEAMMLNNLGYLRRLQGRWKEAEPLHLQSLEIRREIGDRVGQGRILGMLSTLYRNDGRLLEARSAANEAYQLAAEANDRLFMATGLAQIAHVEMGVGDFDAARSAYIEAKAIFAEIEDHSRFSQTTLRLAVIDMQAGDLDAASNSAHEVFAVAHREAMHEAAIEAQELMGDIARKQSDPAAAHVSYQDALTRIEQTGFVSRKSRITVKLANSLLDGGDLASAEALIGYLIEVGDTSQSLKLRARHAFLQADVAQSVKLMESAQLISDRDWLDADDRTLAQYREALNNRHP